MCSKISQYLSHYLKVSTNQVTGCVTVTQDNFENVVLKSTTPVLVDFAASWCGPCKRLAPVLDELAIEMQDSLSIVKIDLDNDTNLAAEYHVQSVPFLLLFKDGKMLDSRSGFVPKDELQSWIMEKIS